MTPERQPALLRKENLGWLCDGTQAGCQPGDSLLGWAGGTAGPGTRVHEGGHRQKSSTWPDGAQASGEMGFLRWACRVNVQASVWLFGLGFCLGFFCSSSFSSAL